MMKKLGFTAGCLFFVPLLFADFLVLKNGTVIQTQGAHQVKGQFVVYLDQAGEMLQLPSKLVDFDASKKRNEAYRAELEAAKDQPKTVAKKDETKSLNQLVNYVDSNRDKDEPLPTNVSITEGSVHKFTQSNPAPTNTAMNTTPIEPRMTVEKSKTEHKRHKEESNRLNGELKDIERKIEETQAAINNLETLMIVGDDPTDGTYKRRESMEQHLKDLEEKKSKKEGEIKTLNRSSRNMGIRDTNRPNKQRRTERKTYKEDLGNYEKGEKGEFDYVEEDSGGL